MTIQMWDFKNAPQEYKSLSRHGGDEDYITYLPQNKLHTKLCQKLVGNVGLNGNFGYHQTFGFTDIHYLNNGDVVIIYAHA